MTDTPDRFEQATLRGGPFDGQVVTVPADEDRLQFFDNMKPVSYYRLGKRNEFYSEDTVSKFWNGDGGRR
jgi:hypothetical protein